MTALAPGSKLGSYEIVAYIGGGGMGSVYSAKNVVTEEPRAIKVMLPELAAQKPFVARFVREIKLASSLAHPNLVRVFEPGMDGDCVFLPMELLEGETLLDRVRARGRLPQGETITCLLAVGSAVLALHGAGVLHRDLKPSNIFLARQADGRIVPKVLDFGAAKAMDATEEQTATGMAIGSPHYMAYEQASGAKDIDERVDQYSLAVVAYQALTGGRPFENDDTGSALAKLLAGAHFKRPRELAPDIDKDVERVLLRGMNRDREKRFPTLKEFLSALETASPDDPTFMVDASLEAGMPALPAGRASTGTLKAVGRSSSSSSSSSSMTAASRGNPATRGAAIGGVVVVAAVLGWLLLVRGASARHDDPLAGQPATPSAPQSVAASPAPPPTDVWTALPVASAAAPLVVASASALSSPSSSSPSPDARRRPPAGGPPAPAAPPATPAPGGAKPGCTPPFYFDSAHHKQYKPECL